MPRDATRSASSDTADRVVPETLRPALAARYGPVYRGAAANAALRRLGVFGACGDLVTARAIEVGRLPLVGIVDYKTRRSETIDPARFAPLAARRTVRVANPAGELTWALRTAVRSLVGSGGGLVEVDGEDDLGSLALVESLPLGATVIYGIPGEGVSFVRVDGAAKDRVTKLIAQMETKTASHGD